MLIHQRNIAQDADIVVNGYAFKRKGEKVEVIDIKRIGPMTEIDPWMEMLLDGTILSRSQNMIDYNTPQKIWKQIRKIDLGVE